MADGSAIAMRRALGRRGAAVVALVPVSAIVVAVVAMRAANDGLEPEGLNWWLLVWGLAAATYGAVGAALLTTASRRTAGVLYALVGAATASALLSTQWAAYRTATSGAPGAAVASLARWSWPLGGAVLVALVPWSVGPSARDRTGPVRATAIAIGAVAAAVLVVGRLGADAPTGVAGAVADAAPWAIAAVGLAGTASLVAAARRSPGDLLGPWLAVGSAAAWIGVVPDLVDVADWHGAGGDVVPALVVLTTVPFLVGGAVVELNRGTVDRAGRRHRGTEWAILTSGVVVVYTVLVAGLGRLVGGSGPTWLLVAATGAIALAVEPARGAIRHLTDRLIYGGRDDPLVLLRGIVDLVGSGGDDLLPTMAASLARELRLDAVAIDLAAAGGWERAASVGAPTGHQREVLLRHDGVVVGRLLLGWTDGAALRGRDEPLLDQLSTTLGLAVSWVRLTADLRRTGLAVVSAREEERRRLRRDLHDGLGPSLTGVSLGLRAALTRLDRDHAAETATTRQLVAHAADAVDSVVHDVKRIVRDLRPAALDQLGLTGSIAAFARTLSDGLDVELDLPRDAVTLPAAVEVAVYRTVTEALTNVVRHAHATHCQLSVGARDEVDIHVVDDGVGMAPDALEGVGLTSMRERAALLGGTVHVGPGPGCGTHVHVRLPAVLP